MLYLIFGIVFGFILFLIIIIINFDWVWVGIFCLALTPSLYAVVCIVGSCVMLIDDCTISVIVSRIGTMSWHRIICLFLTIPDHDYSLEYD